MAQEAVAPAFSLQNRFSSRSPLHGRRLSCFTNDKVSLQAEKMGGRAKYRNNNNNGDIGAVQINNIAWTPTRSPQKKKGRHGHVKKCQTSLFPESSPLDVLADLAVGIDIEEKSGNTVGKELDDDASVVLAELLPSVTVINLPHPFFKEHFLHSLNLAMWEANSVTKSDHSAIRCSDLDENSYATVQFRTVEEASLACLLVDFRYGGRQIAMSQNYKEIIQEDCGHCGEEMSPVVKMSNLENPLFKEHFLYALNSALWEANFVTKGEHAAVSCSDLDENNSSTIEFRTGDDALRACLLDNFCYGGRQIEMHHEIKSQEVVDVGRRGEELSPVVKFANLRKPLFKEHLLHAINSALWESNLVPNGEQSALNCSDLDEANSSTVEFRTAKEASRACHLDFLYEGRKVEMCQHSEQPPVLDLLDEEFSSTVKISNLRDPLFKEHFLYAINSALWESKLVTNGEYSAVSCSDLDEANSSTVEFRTVEEASRACHLNFCYDGREVEMCQQSKEAHGLGVRDEELSCVVEISNLRNPLFKGHFLRALNCALWEAQFIPNGENSALSCSDLNEDNAATVEFRNTTEAALVCLLENLSYEGKKLQLQQLTSKERKRTVIVPVSATPPSLPCPSASLKSTEELRAFLDECVALTRDGTKFIGSTANYEIVLSSLKVRGFTATVDDCKYRMKRLHEQFRRNKMNSPWGSYVAFLRQEPGATRPPRDLPEPPRNCAVQAYTRYTKNFAWTESATLTLIDILLDNKEEYMSVHKNREFWPFISNAMANSRGKYLAGPEACMTHAQALESQYKDYENRRKKTGAGGVSWPFYEHLEPLFGDRLSVQPLRTYAAGACYVSTKNDALVEKETTERVGRSRRSPKSETKSEKLQLIKQLADTKEGLLRELRELNKNLTQHP